MASKSKKDTPMAKTAIKLKPEVEKQVKDYLVILQAAHIPFDKALVFGSQVKGTARANSDIDIAIISPIFGKDNIDERVMLMNLCPYRSFIEPHPMHPDDLNDKWSTFTHEVKKWGIPV